MQTLLAVNKTNSISMVQQLTLSIIMKIVKQTSYALKYSLFFYYYVAVTTTLTKQTYVNMCLFMYMSGYMVTWNKIRIEQLQNFP